MRQAQRLVSPETRARVIELFAEGMGRNAIAREVGISGGSVTTIARDVDHVFERRDTELAVRARQIDLAAARAELAQMLIVRAREALEDMDAPVESGHWSSSTEHTSASYDSVVLDEPTIADRQRLITIAGIGIQRAADLTRASDGGGVEEGISVVMALSDMLKSVAESALKDVDPTKVEAPELPEDPDEDPEPSDV